MAEVCNCRVPLKNKNLTHNTDQHPLNNKASGSEKGRRAEREKEIEEEDEELWHHKKPVDWLRNFLK